MVLIRRMTYIISLLLAISSIAMINSHKAFAAEPGAMNYIAGSAGIFFGEMPPIPGLFMLTHTSFTTADSLYDHNGDKIHDADFDMDAWAETIRIIAAYDKTFLGARLYSQAIVPFVSLENSLSIDTPAGSFSIYDNDDSGMGSAVFSPIIMYWHEQDSYDHYILGLDIATGWGSYDKMSHVNASSGYRSVILGLAYRYDNPTGLDIGFRANFLFNEENSHTDYDTGDTVMLDLLACWNFGKWELGVVGGYTQQFTNDIDDGVDVGNRVTHLGLGPTLSYSTGPFNIELNYQKGLLAKNTSKNDSIWLNLTMPLYVPGMK